MEEEEVMDNNPDFISDADMDKYTSQQDFISDADMKAGKTGSGTTEDPYKLIGNKVVPEEEGLGVSPIGGDIIGGAIGGKLVGTGIDATAKLFRKVRFGGKHGDSPLNVISNVEALLPGSSVAGARKGVAGIDNILGNIDKHKYMGIATGPASQNVTETVVRRAAKGTPTMNTGGDLLGTAYKLSEYALGRNSPYSQELARQAVEISKTNGSSIDDAFALVLDAWRKKAGGKTLGEEITSRGTGIGAATGALLGGSTAN